MTSDPSINDRAAQTAFNAYGDSVGWTAVSGERMPRWNDLAEKIQQAWRKAAAAAVAFTASMDVAAEARRARVAGHVHYVSRGSADGVYPSACRAAFITEVCTPEYLGAKVISEEEANTVGLFVMNPEGTYHLTLGGTGGSKHDAGARGRRELVLGVGGGIVEVKHEPGSWHWVDECHGR